jgi:integrase
MLARKVSVLKVSRWLGHADTKITEQVYAHLLNYDPEINAMNLRNDTRA